MADNYLIIGDDGFLQEREISKIKEKNLSDKELDLNFSAYSPDELGSIMDAAGTAPFLADKRVILIRDAHQLDAKGLDTLLSYLGKPTDTSILVLLAPAEFRKTAAYDKLSGKTVEIKADRPKDHEIKGWVRSYFSREKIDISPDAVDLLVELKGQDTAGLRTELEKLSSYSSGKPISAEDVERLVGRSVTETVFNLVDAMRAKDAAWAYRILSDLSGQKRSAVETIGYLAWHVRNIQKICLLRSQGAAQEEIARNLGMPRWRGMKLMEQANEYTHGAIEKWLSLLLEADRDIKTGLKDADLALEMLVVGLMKA